MPEAQAERFVVADSERGLRLDRFLSRRIPRMSRTSVQEAIASRVTLSSGAAPKPSRQVHAGEVVTILPRTVPVAPEREQPAILHEAEGWMIVDKPAGLSTTPTASKPGEDLVSLTGLHPAHRLDRFTSGCLVLTWTPEAARHFEAVFRRQLGCKEYLAIVHGVPAAPRFTVSAPIARDESSRVPTKMRAAARADAHGADAATDVELLATDGRVSLVRASPLTGRRHQIRVHLAHAGHPLVGDLLYGGDERDFVNWQLGRRIEIPDGLEAGRHLLHAASLTIPDLDGLPVQVRAPEPADFARWSAGLRPSA